MIKAIAEAIAAVVAAILSAPDPERAAKRALLAIGAKQVIRAPKKKP